MELQRYLVLAQRLDRLLHVDLVAVDVDPMLRLQSAGDVLVRDRTKGLILGADLAAHDDGRVVDLVGQRLALDPILRLALDRRAAEPLRLGFDALVRPHGPPARTPARPAA